MKNISVCFLLIWFSVELQGQEFSQEDLAQRWKLIEFNTFDNIRTSPSFQEMAADQQQLFEHMVKTVLDSTVYEFREDGTMSYHEYSNQKKQLYIIQAEWELNGDVLLIKTENQYKRRKAKVLSLAEDQLVLSPMISGTAEGKMTFKKLE